jgi:drug/metabolite transporter (DMT)-like permease
MGRNYKLSGMTTTNKPYAILGLLFAAVTWGYIWYPYRLLQEAGISGAAASFYTYLIATIVGGVFCWRHCASLFKQPRSVAWLALAAGWTNLAYVLAVIDGEVMRVMLLFYLSPLWTLALAHFWLHERTGPWGMAAIVLSLIGAFIMLATPSTPPLPQNTAEWLGLSAGMAFALANVLTRKSHDLSLRVKCLAVWVGVTVVSLLFMLLNGIPLLPSQQILAANGIMLLGVGLLLVAATVAVQYGITNTPVTRASVIFLSELVVAALTSYWLANEALNLREWLGGSLIIVAALLAARAGNR